MKNERKRIETNKQTNSPNENQGLFWINVSVRFTLRNNFINNSLYLILTSAIRESVDTTHKDIDLQIAPKRKVQQNQGLPGPRA
jgi:aspartyl-tRNA synthetase